MITKTTELNQALYDELFTEASKLLTNVTIRDLGDYYKNIKDIATAAIEGDQPQYKFLKLPLDEPCFVIDNNTRTINIPAEYRSSVAVAGDTYAESLFFSVDRYFDLKDLGQTQILIHWSAPSPTGGRYEGYSKPWIVDFWAEQDKIIFGWMLYDEIIEHPGSIIFSVEFYETNEAKEITYSLNTRTTSVTTLDTLHKDWDPAKPADFIGLDEANVNTIVSRLINSTDTEYVSISVPVFKLLDIDHAATVENWKSESHILNDLHCIPSRVAPTDQTLDGDPCYLRVVAAPGAQASGMEHPIISCSWKEYRFDSESEKYDWFLIEGSEGTLDTFSSAHSGAVALGLTKDSSPKSDKIYYNNEGVKLTSEEANTTTPLYEYYFYYSPTGPGNYKAEISASYQKEIDTDTTKTYTSLSRLSSEWYFANTLDFSAEGSFIPTQNFTDAQVATLSFAKPDVVGDQSNAAVKQQENATYYYTLRRGSGIEAINGTFNQEASVWEPDKVSIKTPVVAISRTNEVPNTIGIRTEGYFQLTVEKVLNNGDFIEHQSKIYLITKSPELNFETDINSSAYPDSSTVSLVNTKNLAVAINDEYYNAHKQQTGSTIPGYKYRYIVCRSTDLNSAPSINTYQKEAVLGGDSGWTDAQVYDTFIPKTAGYYYITIQAKLNNSVATTFTNKAIFTTQYVPV